MPRALSPEHPNLVKAASRMRRILFAWATVSAGVGLLGLFTAPRTVPVLWVGAALLLVLEQQPALLGMVAVSWSLSLLGLSTELNQALALDPVGLLFGGEVVGSLSLAFVRLVLALMAWNQFLFYRLLYGTQAMIGLSTGLPDIPEMIPNRTDRLVAYSWFGITAGGLALLFSFTLASPEGVQSLLTISLGLAALSIGLGIGVAFSPTHRRAAALASVALGSLMFLYSVASLNR